MVARLQMKAIDHCKRKASISTIVVMQNSTLSIMDMKIMEMYSPKKIIRNGIELNSVLKPLTNSDSPSEKSNGDRLVSAIDAT